MSLKLIIELAIPAIFFCFMSIIVMSLIHVDLKRIGNQIARLNGDKEDEESEKKIDVSKL